MTNLQKVLREKGISTKTVAAIIGVAEKTAYNKIYGVSECSISEAFAIQRDLLPEYTLEYIFELRSAEEVTIDG